MVSLNAPSFVAMSAPHEVAYDALRTVWFPWQRERRLAKQRERVRIARMWPKFPGEPGNLKVLGDRGPWGFPALGSRPEQLHNYWKSRTSIKQLTTCIKTKSVE